MASRRWLTVGSLVVALVLAATTRCGADNEIDNRFDTLGDANQVDYSTLTLIDDVQQRRNSTLSTSVLALDTTSESTPQFEPRSVEKDEEESSTNSDEESVNFTDFMTSSSTPLLLPTSSSNMPDHQLNFSTAQSLPDNSYTTNVTSPDVVDTMPLSTASVIVEGGELTSSLITSELRSTERPTSANDVTHELSSSSRVDSTISEHQTSNADVPEVTSFQPDDGVTSTGVAATSFLTNSSDSTTKTEVTITSRDSVTVPQASSTCLTPASDVIHDSITSSTVGSGSSAESRTGVTTVVWSTPIAITGDSTTTSTVLPVELTTSLPVWPLSVAVLAGSVAAISIILIFLVILITVFVCRCRTRKRRSFKGDSGSSSRVRYRNDMVRVDLRKRSKRPPSSPDGCDFDGAYTPLARSAPPSSALRAENVFKGSFPQHQNSRTDVAISNENISPVLFEKDSDVESLNGFSMATFCARNAAYKGHLIDQ